MNEFDVVHRISGRLPDPPPEVVVPIGDDCAVLRFGDALWVAASDMLVSGRHFRGWAAPEDIGYKAVAVNVSDVAAMGAATLTVDVAVLGQLAHAPVLHSEALREHRLSPLRAAEFASKVTPRRSYMGP